MRTARRHYAGFARCAILATAAFSLVTGCGVTVNGASTESEQATADEQQYVEWNPCSELPAEALRATGADPAKKHTSFDAPGDQAVFRICFWDATTGPYNIGVGSTTFIQDQWYDNTAITGISSRQVNDRPALTFYPNNGDNPIRQCYVSFPTQDGSVFVDVNWRYSQRSSLPESPPCELAVQHAQKIEPYLPK